MPCYTFKKYRMKSLSVSLLFVFILIMFNCDKVNSNEEFKGEMKTLENLFYAYDFTMENMTRKARVEFLDSLGYQGVLFPLNSTAFKEYTEAIALVNENFRIPAVYYNHQMDAPDAAQSWKNHVGHVAGTNTDLLLIVSTQSGEDVPRADLEQFFKEVAVYAAERNVNIVIYPHSGTLIESAAEALPYVKAVNRDNFNLSFHLCHELLAGNGERMNEAVAEVAPYIKQASICGADLKQDVSDYNKWGDLIKPLYKGNYDTSLFLKALINNGYTGPIALHTYGLQEPVDEHYPKSMEEWKKMTNELVLNTDIIDTDDTDLIIYPNPVSGMARFRFSAETSGKAVLAIVNMNGAIVLQKEFYEVIRGENQLELNFSHLKNGVYTGIIRLNDKQQMKRKFLVTN